MLATDPSCANDYVTSKQMQSFFGTLRGCLTGGGVRIEEDVSGPGEERICKPLRRDARVRRFVGKHTPVTNEGRFIPLSLSARQTGQRCKRFPLFLVHSVEACEPATNARRF